MSQATVIHHSADWDGNFCREIARKFLPDAELIGWDFGDPPLSPGRLTAGKVYVMDLPVDCVFGWDFRAGAQISLEMQQQLVWIDHHRSSIDSHPREIPGYRIDGVAACRLAWQWFDDKMSCHDPAMLPGKQEFSDRKVFEPMAVRLAGEFDVWDHRDDDADVAFQFGLDAQTSLNWDGLLDAGLPGNNYVHAIVHEGRAAMQCYKKRDADVMRSRSFYANFEGLTFLCLNTARCNSNTFAAKDLEVEAIHDALLAFYWTGNIWSVSMYHAAHRKDLDLSKIAVKHGGGGHPGACGFQLKQFRDNLHVLPFLG